MSAWKLRKEWVDYIVHRYSALRIKQALQIVVAKEGLLKIDVVIQYNATPPKAFGPNQRDKMVKLLEGFDWEHFGLQIWEHYGYGRMKKLPVLESGYTQAVKIVR